MKPFKLEGKIEEINLKKNYVSLTYLDYASFHYLDKASCEELEINLNDHENLKKQMKSSKLKKGDIFELQCEFEENKVNYTRIEKHKNSKKVISELEKISKELNFF